MSTSFPRLLTEIDELTRQDHYYLGDTDRCFFLGEYTARKGFSHSPTNNLILNFKKSIETRGTAQWRWKEAAVSEASSALRNALGGPAVPNITFVPIPPSKAKTDRLYDDRMVRALRGIGPTVDVRELLLQTVSTAAAHESVDRPTPASLQELYTIDEQQTNKIGQTIAICDDVLTTGCHFVAGKKTLADRFPQATFVGLFLARRAPESIDFEDFEI